MVKKFVPRSEKTRQFIIEKTSSIFNKKGYAGTSLSDLTTATGLTKGSIYGNFKNKEDIAIAVFEYNYLSRVKPILESVAKAKSSKDKLLVYYNAYNDKGFESHLKDGGCALLNFGLEVDDTSESLRKIAEFYIIAWKVNLIDILKRGIKNNEVRSDINLESTALTMIGIIQGAVYIGKVTNDFKQMRIALNSLKTLIQEILKE